MDQLTLLNDRIISRVNINLSEFDFDTEGFVKDALDHEKMLKFYAFYGITSQHPIFFDFRHSNIAGSYFLGAFSTVDLMNLHSCIIGEFAYVQAGELFHRKIDPGTVWIRHPNFEFKFRFEKGILDNFVGINASHQPRGLIYDFVKEREQDYEKLFDVMILDPFEAPPTSAVNRYAVIKGKTRIGENVLVAQRAFLENAIMGDGSNAQENTYIVDSTLEGLNITAHGGKIINALMGHGTFVGFNSFLNGKPEAMIEIGERCIVMPHTIIDPEVSIRIPAEHLIWGFIRSEEDIKTHTISLDDLAEVRDTLRIGKMAFSGKGSIFLDVFRKRISNILLQNGARFHKGENRGHAQDDQNISFNLIQPYTTGKYMGLYPSIRIKP